MTRQLFNIGIVFLIIYVVLSALTKAELPAVDKSTLPPLQFNQYQLIRQLLNEQRNDEALPHLETLLRDTHIPDSLKAWLYVQKATIHQSRRHFHFALDDFHLANQFNQNPHLYDAQIRKLERVIKGMQQERLQLTTYRDARNQGMSKNLSGQITVIYVYIDDQDWSPWSAKSRQQNQFNLNQVLQWYRDQASHYSLPALQLDVRYFILNSPKGIGKTWLRDPNFFNQAQGLLTQQLGYRDLASFIADIQGTHQTSQIALVFHANNQSRSFAHICYQYCDTEYVMLTEKMSQNPYAWATPQVQAHEMLHLFGAMDLYNIRDAKDYAVTDLMNYYSQALKYADISPVTAWAIGWADQQPDTPFPIQLSR